MTRRSIIFLPFIALISVAAIFAACGDDDDAATNTPAATTAAATASPADTGGEGEEVTFDEADTFLRGLVAAYNEGDVEGLLAHFDDEALLSFTGDEPGTSREDAIAGALEFLGGNTITIRDITDEGADDGASLVEMESDDGVTVALESYKIERDGDDFLVTEFAHLDPPIPDGATTVLVEGTEYQYIFDETEITDPNIVFEFSNIGSQFHELYLLEIDATTPVDDIVTDALAAEDPSQLPPTILKDIGPVFAGPGGPPSYFVPAAPFEAGRYMMICFIPDQSVPEGEEGQPHAALGMYAEFTIP